MMTYPLDSVKSGSENISMDTKPQHPSARDALLAAARDELAEKGHASVSLRAVARRAGVSHAAPAHFFGDRAGMLTAVATDGFRMLARALDSAADGSPTSRLEALGRAYVEFGLAEPALFDLMFRRSELSPDDPALAEAQQEALGSLRAAVSDIGRGDDREGWSLVSWAVVHGLVTLVREGVLAPIAGRDVEDGPDLARELVTLYASGVGGVS